jgi:hypothetical protein
MSDFEVVAQIGKGSQHIVGELEDGRLIKYTHWKGWLWDKSTFETVRKDMQTLINFGIPIPETDVVKDPVIDTGRSKIKRPYAILAERIRGRVFREIDLENESIQGQITEILKKSIIYRGSKNAAIDFLGGEAISQFFRYLIQENKSGQLGAYNILIDDAHQLKLIDTNLLDPSRAPFGTGWLINASIDLQHALLTFLLENQSLILACMRDNQFSLTTVLAQKLYHLSRNIESKRK